MTERDLRRQASEIASEDQGPRDVKLALLTAFVALVSTATHRLIEAATVEALTLPLILLGVSGALLLVLRSVDRRRSEALAIRTAKATLPLPPPEA